MRFRNESHLVHHTTPSGDQDTQPHPRQDNKKPRPTSARLSNPRQPSLTADLLLAPSTLTARRNSRLNASSSRQSSRRNTHQSALKAPTPTSLKAPTPTSLLKSSTPSTLRSRLSPSAGPRARLLFILSSATLAVDERKTLSLHYRSRFVEAAYFRRGA